MRDDYPEVEAMGVGCAFVVLALLAVLFLVLPMLDELSQDPYEQLRRDEQQQREREEYAR